MQESEQLRRVTVEAPARLHLGFLDLNGNLGREFGSIGMGIDSPSTVVDISPAPVDNCVGPEAERAERALARLKSALGYRSCYDIRVRSAIPAHAGLGSGTQLALAVGMGIATLEGAARPVRQIGESLSRGARSAIGIATFKDGGFVVDGGKGASTRPPPVISRVSFPDDWRVVLVLDPNAVGVHGDRETAAFENLAPMVPEDAGTICRLTLMQLLPGLIEHDIGAFGRAITAIQEIVGSHFATAQGGGIWASAHVAALVGKMRELGAHGIGQSSWGPTGFAFAESQDAAEYLYHSLVQDAKGRGLELIIARGRNRGAVVSRPAISEPS